MTTSYSDPDADAPAPVAPAPAMIAPAGPPETLPAGAPSAHVEQPARPLILAMQALGLLYARSSFLPDLQFTLTPHGIIVGRVSDSVPPEVAARDYYAWREVLRAGAQYFAEVPRYADAYQWFELQGHISPAPRDPRATLMPVQILGRRFASTAFPAMPAAPGGGL